MNHLGDTNKMVSTPSVCPFCGSYVATLDDGKSCGDSEGNWVAFRCLTSWHRGYHDPRKLQSKTCETVERHKLYDRIKRLEEALDLVRPHCDSVHHSKKHQHQYGEPCPVVALIENAKEAKL